MTPATLQLSEDKSSLTIEPLPAKVTITAAQVEQLLQDLLVARHSMVPAVSFDPPKDRVLKTLRSPVTKVADDIGGHGALISIRDPAWGWRHFQYTIDEARAMRDALQTILDSHAEDTKH